MGFATQEYLCFLAVTVAVYATSPKRWRPYVLTAASYIFYWLSDGWLALLLLATTLMAFYAARIKSAALMAMSVLVALLILFKSLLLVGVTALIPLGVSYYTFKLAGYLLDVYWEAVEPERQLVPFLAFAAFFPQIVGGPIQRAQTFLPQIRQAADPTADTIVRGTLRIILGFFKKFVVADNIGLVVNYVYSHLTANPGVPVALGFYGYPLQMYADFSGLTDIAIGSGIMLGISGLENFNAPFIASNPSEYWRRWHISLTQWMGDYVFTPLRMATRTAGNVGLVLSIFINMVLIGLWHGFHLTFALFGALHAFYLSVDALSQRWRNRLYSRHKYLRTLVTWLGPLITFHLIAIAFVFFRADSLDTIGAVFTHLFSGWQTLSPQFQDIVSLLPLGSLYGLAAVIIVQELADALRRHRWNRPLTPCMERWERWSLYGCTAVAALFTVCLVATRAAGSTPFLYAIF